MQVAATVVGSAVAAYIVAHFVARADAPSVWKALGSGGPLVALALVPFALGMTIDAYGTVVILRVLRSRVTVAQMLPVRIACEALHLSVPAGFVAADTVTAVLLETRSEVPLRDGFVASIARKRLVMRAHAAYIVLGALAGFPALAHLSIGPIAPGAFPWIVLVSAAVPLAASWMLGAGLLGRSTFTTLHTALTRLPSLRLRRWLEARRSEAAASDGQIARLHAARPATAIATLAFLGCWCVEALESVLLLRLVGVDISLGAIIAIEAGLSLVRSLVVFAPSGLGVTDLGYATVLPMLGAPPGSAAAFVLLKRTKELVWVMAGYAMLGFLRGRAPSGASLPTTSGHPSRDALAAPGRVGSRRGGSVECARTGFGS